MPDMGSNPVYEVSMAHKGGIPQSKYPLAQYHLPAVPQRKTMKIQIEIPDTLVETTVRSIMDNYPEASQGNSLHCTGWKYDACLFNIEDGETGKKYLIGLARLMEVFPLIFTDKWPKGCTQPPHSRRPDEWDEWLCYCDAGDFDAFLQLACLGEVIYG